MKIYDFYCDNHGKFERIVDTCYVEWVVCSQCGNYSKKMPSFRGKISVFHDYYAPALDKHITGAKQLRDECKKAGITALRPGDTIDKGKVKRERRRKLVAEAEKVADRTIKETAETFHEGPIPGIKKAIEKEKEFDRALRAT